MQRVGFLSGNFSSTVLPFTYKSRKMETYTKKSASTTKKRKKKKD